ncbi:MAG: DUF3808 domain-containing protein [Deltaproteobacteria bacterium]|nr:DUF3808 domain-containing protein [Deltaproteobacteria bacterium]
MLKKFVLFVLILIVPQSAFAQTPEPLLQALQHIYHVRFAEAQKIIGQYIVKHPEDAQGYILRGILKEWDQLVNNRGKSKNDEIMDEFQKARILGTDALEKDPDNVHLKTVLANAYLYVSKKQIDTGHKGQSGLSLKKAKNLMEEVIQKDPNNHQAYFSIGLFNYFADRVPSGFKWLAKLIGISGDAKKGLAYLHKAAQVPSLTQVDAEFMLVYILSRREGRYKDALVYAADLYKRYPENHVFLFDYSEMLFRTKNIAESREQFAKYFEFCEQNKGVCSQDLRYLSNYFVAWSYIDEKDFKNAKPYLIKADELNNKRYKDRSQDIENWKKLVGI